MTSFKWSAYSAAVLALVAATAAPAFAQEANPAGKVKVASGAAFIVRNGTAIPAQPGQAVFEARRPAHRRRRNAWASR